MYLSACVPVCMPSCLCVVVFQYVYVDMYSLHVLVYILNTCTCLHTHYNVTCTCLHTHYMYLSTYSLHVVVYILTTCTCLHTHYMYLSTGGRSEVISSDPKIAPVNDQPSVYGELTDSGQMVQNYNIIVGYYRKTSTVLYVHYTY